MIEPGDRIFDCLDRGASRRAWPAQHDNVNVACARRGDLAVGRGTAAVLCNYHVDAMLGHQRMVVGFGERAAAGDVADMRQWQWRIDRIDAANQIMMLRRFAERLKLVAAEGDKDAARRLTDRPYGLTDIAHLDPSIPGSGEPRRPPQRDQRHAASPRGCEGVCRNHSGVRMRGIDHGIDALADEIVRETFGAAKAADADWNLLRGRRGGAAGKRQRDIEAGTVGKAPGQLSRFGGAAENKDACHACF